jgi:UDP-MurNAc hydroxylase
MTTKFIWINHAGYELVTGGLRIVHDPWLVGHAFDNGWSLLSETAYTEDNFSTVDYIWFSHEHPDHFSPASIKKIPIEFRSKITVLFQDTKDKRVINFCKNAGFKTIELKNQVEYHLNEKVSIICGRAGRDSWLYTKTEDVTIFNANDCVDVNWAKVRSSLPRNPDILLTQFSYANWVGNPGEHERMKVAAENKMSEMREQIGAFNPEIIIPFASYIWFCRPENFHMNEHANSVRSVVEEIGKEKSMVVLYPGDSYIVGQPHDNGEAISRYDSDAKNITGPLDIQDNEISINDLKLMSDKEQKRLENDNIMLFLKPLKWFGIIKPISIYLDDLDEGIKYSMFGGIWETGLKRTACDLAFSSTSFAMLLRNGYGYGTLSINGRFVELRSGGNSKLSRHFAIAARNEEGETIPGLFLQTNYLMFQFRRFLGFA